LLIHVTERLIKRVQGHARRSPKLMPRRPGARSLDGNERLVDRAFAKGRKESSAGVVDPDEVEAVRGCSDPCARPVVGGDYGGKIRC